MVSFVKCREQCDGIPADCFSIDYNHVKNSCNLNMVNQKTAQPGDFTKPCYENPNDNLYAERIPGKTISFTYIMV